MAIRVVILRQGSPHILKQWDEEYISPLNLEQWEKGSCLWPSSLLNDQTEPMEVYLCLDGETLASGYDAPSVSRVIVQARKSMWGANIYVVVDSALLLDGQKQFRASREKWFEILLDSGVSDVLQWEVNRGKWERHSRTTLNEAAARAEKRSEEMITHEPTGLWKCLLHKLPDHGSEHESFLSPYLIRSVSQIGNDNCLVILNPNGDDHGLAYLQDEVFATNPTNKVMVGVVDQVEEPSQKLKEICNQNGCDPLWFHGLFEVHYFLQKLNEANQKDVEPTNVATSVSVALPRTFKVHSPQELDGHVPTILVTHSFSESDESGCHVAANDFWQLTRNLRGRVNIRVYPAVECVRLPHVLKELQRILVWMHIGHGDGEKGLKQAGGLFKTADDWLNGFAGYEASLPLVVFASCRSAAIAERFASSGAGVTIGFVERVAKKVSVHLTSRVVEAALHSNGTREAILKGFSEGRQVLKIEDPDAMPVAFWAKH